MNVIKGTYMEVEIQICDFVELGFCHLIEIPLVNREYVPKQNCTTQMFQSCFGMVCFWFKCLLNLRSFM